MFDSFADPAAPFIERCADAKPAALVANGKNEIPLRPRDRRPRLAVCTSLAVS